MIRSSLVAMLAICAVCSFCGKDFVTLGRHSWRCKEKINQDRPANTVNQKYAGYAFSCQNLKHQRRKVLLW
jgi:tRNA(Ile2) C34 agmatinyltransferase TiaS